MGFRSHHGEIDWRGKPVVAGLLQCLGALGADAASAGNAIAKAQRGDGRLPLQRWRDGRIGKVTLKLPLLPGDSMNGPFEVETPAAIDKLKVRVNADGSTHHNAYLAQADRR